MIKNKKVTVPIIIILSLAVVAGGIICAVIFWPKKPLTMQEQLNQFKASLETINDTTVDSDGNPAARNIVRSIIITENGEVVAEYRQILKIYVDAEKKLTAYLSFEEKYPTLETTEFDVFDEYYLSNGVMYTRRNNDGDVTVSSFDSNIETFFIILFENIGNLKYDFSEGNFVSFDEGTKLINKEGNTSKLSALINTEKYAQFFGDNTNVSNISDVKLEMSMTDSNKFNSLILTYIENELNVALSIKGYQIDPIHTLEWI